MKTYAALFLSMTLCGCGTINTTFSSDSVAANKLARWKSSCSSIPRVYSGVALDYCALDAEPRPLRGQSIHPSASLMLLDMAASGVVDTLVLPYSFYLQSQYGDIKASRFD